MASIRLQDVAKVYAGGQAAVRDLNLDIADGEFMVLVGPSGCGKSTTLRMIAGLETPTAGKITIGDAEVTYLPPQERDLAMVFQSYALYPHKTVRQNLEFGLRMRRTQQPVIDERVARVSKILGLEALLDRRPSQLSGGQRQRVALGRAMVREPKAFLLDEPLSNLDAKLRVQTRAELARMHRQLGATMIYVTHDQEEAMTLGDRITVLKDGELQQVAAPMELYRRPANAFVAGFIGSPAMNFLDCTLRGDNGLARLESPYFSLTVDKIKPVTDKVQLGIRPQDLKLAEAEGADAKARVDVIQPLGSDLLVHLALAGKEGETPITLVTPAETRIAVDDTVGLQFPRDRLHVFDARSGKAMRNVE